MVDRNKVRPGGCVLLCYRNYHPTTARSLPASLIPPPISVPGLSQPQAFQKEAQTMNYGRGSVRFCLTLLLTSLLPQPCPDGAGMG